MQAKTDVSGTARWSADAEMVAPYFPLWVCNLSQNAFIVLQSPDDWCSTVLGRL